MTPPQSEFGCIGITASVVPAQKEKKNMLSTFGACSLFSHRVWAQNMHSSYELPNRWGSGISIFGCERRARIMIDACNKFPLPYNYHFNSAEREHTDAQVASQFVMSK
jgi:hypothetical protein